MDCYLSLNDKNLRRQYVAAIIKNMSIGSSRICRDSVKTPVSEMKIKATVIGSHFIS